MSDSNGMAADLVGRRGNRCTATILSQLERTIKGQLPDEVWAGVRRTILDNINEFKDLAIDVVKSDQAIINEEYLSHLVDIKTMLRANGSH